VSVRAELDFCQVCSYNVLVGCAYPSARYLTSWIRIIRRPPPQSAVISLAAARSRRGPSLTSITWGCSPDSKNQVARPDLFPPANPPRRKMRRVEFRVLRVDPPPPRSPCPPWRGASPAGHLPAVRALRRRLRAAGGLRQAGGVHRSISLERKDTETQRHQIFSASSCLKRNYPFHALKRNYPFHALAGRRSRWELCGEFPSRDGAGSAGHGVHRSFRDRLCSSACLGPGVAKIAGGF
jgi:hypothetical protein